MRFKQTLFTSNKSKGTNTCEYILLHHTATKEGSIQGVLKTLTVGAVSCHYVVDTNGDVYKIGQDTDILWHAGVSAWKGREDMNRYCIGIEVIWPLDNIGFTDEQRRSVRELVSYLQNTYNIPSENIIRHKDIAPNRKIDIDDRLWKNEFSTFADYQRSFSPMSDIEKAWMALPTEARWFSDYSDKRPITGREARMVADIRYWRWHAKK